MGIALGLGAALSWGLADYFAAVASRQVGALRVVLGFHLVALAPLAILAVATGALRDVGSSQVLALAGIGAVGWLSYLAFYGALAIGPISVLSPIVSGYAAVTVLLAVGVLGERLATLQALAVSVTIAGAVVASADVRQIASARLQRRSVIGFAKALAAMVLLGGFVFGVSYYRPQIGWLAPIFLARAFSAVFLFAHLLGAGGARGLRWPRRVLAMIVGLAAVDTGGYVFFNLGVAHAATAIVAAAASSYALVPVAMGVSLFGERPSRVQWSGVALVIAGVIGLGAVG